MVMQFKSESYAGFNLGTERMAVTIDVGPAPSFGYSVSVMSGAMGLPEEYNVRAHDLVARAPKETLEKEFADEYQRGAQHCVFVRFSDPESSTAVYDKFLLAYHKQDPDRQVLVAMPRGEFPNHADIATMMMPLLGKWDWELGGGGRMSLEGEEIIVWGTSDDFGRASSEKTKALLEERYPGIPVRIEMERRQ